MLVDVGCCTTGSTLALEDVLMDDMVLIYLTSYYQPLDTSSNTLLKVDIRKECQRSSVLVVFTIIHNCMGLLFALSERFLINAGQACVNTLALLSYCCHVPSGINENPQVIFKQDTHVPGIAQPALPQLIFEPKFYLSYCHSPALQCLLPSLLSLKVLAFCPSLA